MAPFSAKLAVSKKGEQLMSQPILPLITSGATQVGELLSIVREDEHTKYYMGTFQIGIHKTSDKATFKAKICELIFCGLCRNKDVLNNLAVSSSSLKRWMRQYKGKRRGCFAPCRLLPAMDFTPISTMKSLSLPPTMTPFTSSPCWRS